MYNTGRQVNQIEYRVQPFMLSKKGKKEYSHAADVFTKCHTNLQSQQNAKNKTCLYITLCFHKK